MGWLRLPASLCCPWLGAGGGSGSLVPQSRGQRGRGTARHPAMPDGRRPEQLSPMFRESRYCHQDGHLGDVCPGQCRAPGGKRRLQRWLPVQLRSRCARGGRPSSPARRQWLCLPHGPWHPSPLAASLPAGLCCGPGGTLIVPQPRWLQDSCPQSCFRRSEKSSESWSVACSVPSTSVSTEAIGPRAGPAPRAGPEGFSLGFLSWE